MRWTKRRKEKIFIHLLVTTTLGTVATGVLVALASILHLR
jgi:hypothetical protein